MARCIPSGVRDCADIPMNSKETIISAAADYILEKGDLSDSIRDIAKNVGTSHRMVNYHFGGSDGFWEALVNEIRKKEILRIRHLHEENKYPLSVSPYVNTFITQEYKKVFNIVLEIYLKALKNPDGFSAFRHSYIDDWIASISQGIDRQYPEIRNISGTLARIKVAFIRGILLDYFMTNDVQALMQACKYMDNMLQESIAH
jgi:AcrR family transcriptional regulator